MPSFARTPYELKEKAVHFWPSTLLAQEKNASVIPILISTQDKFISILDVADSTPDAWKTALSATSELPANLFLKHLMVLSDIGGENLKRIKSNFRNMFPDGILPYSWRGTAYDYRFAAIPNRPLTNKSLFVDGNSLLNSHPLNPLIEDTIMLLLHGGASTSKFVPDFVQEKCIIGGLIGQKTTLEKFVKQRYILVSRITGGATANKLGQIAQDFVREQLIHELPNWTIRRNGAIPGMSQNAGETDMSFDIVARSPSNKWTGIEVCFQFTTNSVIERKSGQAQARSNLLHGAGHKIAYVIDGAGNFERMSALTNICNHSDCTVAFSEEEIRVLATFLRDQEAQ